MEKVVIIGSGPAGWTAALYTARAQLAPLVLTGQQPGGLLTTTSIVENFPGFPEGVDGYELMTRMQKQAERFGAKTSFGVVESVDFSKRPFWFTVDGEKMEAETVIIATGARPQTSWRARRTRIGKQRHDLLRDVRRRAAGVPQPAARRGRRRRFRVRRGAVSDALRLGRLSGPSPRFPARVQNHGRAHAG